MATETIEEQATTEEEQWEPRIIGILCYWCSYAGADLAGSSRLNYPANIRIVRIPCSGRADPLFVLRAFERGADGVLVAGCHPGDCHYAEGNYYARRRMSLLKRLVKYAGIPEERFKALWVSASEGKEFAHVINEMVEEIRPLGPFRPELAARFKAMPPVKDMPGEECPEHADEAEAV
ncbi:MAG: hydrogenase iron-sulfur subunit [Armatimonadia bacterium]